jgi:hypothetical protein
VLRELPSTEVLKTISGNILRDSGQDWKRVIWFVSHYHAIFSLIHVCCLSLQFVAMAGTDVLAFCSSGNLLIAQRLNVPSMLLSVPGDMLVSRVVIENHSAYTDAVLRVNNDNW